MDNFGEAPVGVGHDTEIGDGVRLMYAQDAALTCTVRRSIWIDPLGGTEPTLLIAGTNRAPEDWFGLEVDLPARAMSVAITFRNYPAHRLFPRVHFETRAKTGHVDLADVAAADSFATRTFPASQWHDHPSFQKGIAENPRLTVLVPSTPWFTMELRDVTVLAGADA